MKKPCFNIIFEDDNITIPEIDDTDFLNFGLTFIKIKERELKTLTKKVKCVPQDAPPVSIPAALSRTKN